MLFFYITATDKFSDDILYAISNPLQDGIAAMVIDIYHNWSARIFISPVMVALILSPIWLWRILDLAVWLILAVSISKLFAKDDNADTNWFIVALMMLYPYWHMATAGWIATTTNFTWPLAAGMFILLTLKRTWEGVRLPAYRWILSGIAFLYATDAEQSLMILVIVFTALIAHQLYTKANTPQQYRIFLFTSFFLLIARLIFTLTAPGNHVRRLSGHYTVPGFLEYSLGQQLTLSFELTAMHYIHFTLALFPFFSLLLVLAVWGLHKSVLKRLISVVPFLISVIFTCITVVNALIFARDNLTDYEGWFLDGFIMMSIPSWSGSNLLFIFFFMCLLYTLYLSQKNILDSCRVIGIMVIGFLSQLMLGISPSLYGSALRTFVYTSFAIIICAVYVYENSARAYLKKWMKVLLASMCCINFAITLVIGIVRMTA
jgi:hypothetical protein